MPGFILKSLHCVSKNNEAKTVSDTVSAMSSFAGVRAAENDTFFIFAEQEMKVSIYYTYKRAE